MKPARLFSVLKIAFVIIGAIAGAGFISGKELIRFFGSGFLLPSVYIGAVLFAMCFYLFLILGKRYGGLESTVKAVFKGGGRVVSCALLGASVITVSAMLAGLDSLAEMSLGLSKDFPLVSITTLIICYFITKKGVKGLSAVNLVIVPVVITVILTLVPIKTDITVELSHPEAGDGMFLAVVYVSMNIFLSAPILLELGKRNDEKALMPAALIAAGIIGVCIFFIVSGVKYEAAAAVSEMPVLYLFSNMKLFFMIFSAVVYFGIITTILSSYFPLYNMTQGKFKRKILADIFVLAVTFAISRMGLTLIVAYLYPFLGFMGLVFIVFSALHLRKKKNSGFLNN